MGKPILGDTYLNCAYADKTTQVRIDQDMRIMPSLIFAIIYDSSF